MWQRRGLSSAVASQLSDEETGALLEEVVIALDVSSKWHQRRFQSDGRVSQKVTARLNEC